MSLQNLRICGSACKFMIVDRKIGIRVMFEEELYSDLGMCSTGENLCKYKSDVR